MAWTARERLGDEPALFRRNAECEASGWEGKKGEIFSKKQAKAPSVKRRPRRDRGARGLRVPSDARQGGASSFETRTFGRRLEGKTIETFISLARMIYILFSVLLTASLVIILKFAQQKNENHLLSIITINYYVATLGTALLHFFSENSLPKPGIWIFFAMLGGAIFIGIFFLIGYATHKIGAGYTGILFKVSLIIPVIFSLFYYAEPFFWNHFVGILLAIGAVVLINYSQLGKANLRELLLVGGTIFLGSGLADINFKYMKMEFGNLPDTFVMVVVFATAAFLGTVALLFSKNYGKIFLFENFRWGTLLGIANFLSLYFFMLALQEFPGTLFFPVNHVGTLLAIGILDVLLFRPTLNASYRWGMISAIAAILLLSI